MGYYEHHIYGCFQKLGYPKMDGENNGKPYEQMDEVPLFLETPICVTVDGNQ